MKSLRFIPLFLSSLVPALVTSVMAQTTLYVGNLDGTNIQSTFTTSADGTNALSGFGWESYTGVSARVFGQTGGTTNDVLIASDGNNYANYGVQFNTGVSLLPNTTYTISYLVGYVSSGTLASNNFTAAIGTWNGTSFTSLAESAATVNRSSNAMTGASIGASVSNSIAVSFTYTTSSTVSADDIMFRWVQTNSAIQIFGESDYFGIDNVVISYPGSAVPEPSTWAAIAGVTALGFAMWRRRSLR